MGKESINLCKLLLQKIWAESVALGKRQFDSSRGLHMSKHTLQ